MLMLVRMLMLMCSLFVCLSRYLSTYESFLPLLSLRVRTRTRVTVRSSGGSRFAISDT